MGNYKDWKINQFLAGCIITFGGFGFGTALSWTATALPSLQETAEAGDLTSTEMSWISTTMTLGALIACPLSGLFLRDIGRKTCLIIFCALGFAGWLLLAGASDSIPLYLGRALLGASSGGYTIFVPIYVSEIASKENRGFIGSIFLIMLCLGKLFSNIVGILFPASTASLLCSLHAVIYAMSLLLIPESPKALMRQKKEKQAFSSFSWYEARGIKSLFSHLRKVEISHSVKAAQDIWITLDNMNPESSLSTKDPEKASSIEDSRVKPGVWSKNVAKPLLTVYTLMMLAQFCGINVSTFYTVEIFQMSGDLLIESKKATVILALIQTIGCLPCSIFVDKYGRKVLLVSSFLCMGLATASFSAFFYFKETVDISTLQTYSYIGLVPLISLIVYNLAYSWGVGSVVWIIMSEIIPPAIIGPASAIANVIFWGCAFIILQSFHMLKDQTPMYTWFITFTAICAFGCIFILICLPETKGLTSEEIQALYKTSSNINHDSKSKSESTSSVKDGTNSITS